MGKKKSDKLVYITGRRIILRPLIKSDFTVEYLSWLNDPVVNFYSQRRHFPSSWEDMVSYDKYYAKNPKKGFVLAIVTKRNNIHIGNISLVNVQYVNRCAEIAILIGNKRYWNRGYGQEAIYAITKHAFLSMNLHKIFAGSFNPAFVACVKKLGWKKEGEFRDAIWSNGSYHNQVWMAILRPEFKIIPKFEHKDKISQR